MYEDLKGKTAIVTGASRGIGKAIANLLASEGASVICAARTLNEGDHFLEGSLTSTVEEIKAAGNIAEAVAADTHPRPADAHQSELQVRAVRGDFHRLRPARHRAFRAPGPTPRPRPLGGGGNPLPARDALAGAGDRCDRRGRGGGRGLRRAAVRTALGRVA